jgi:hypothetical protein
MSLSNVFKFTQGLGQKGHQIGRKVGDAIELLTLGMVNLDNDLTNFLIIEDGVEGATSAKHKVEFSFYNLNNGRPSKKSNDLFGIIECKKVGVEQTVKSNFKSWKGKAINKRNFYETDGYKFISSPTGTNFKWSISVNATENNGNNIKVITNKQVKEIPDVINDYSFNCEVDTQILIAVDVDNNLHVLGPNQILSEIELSLNKCIIIQVTQLEDGRIKKINVNESLAGPQTPEKAKQASFVSLDVRKKVMGRFDQTADKSFVSILVIGEASHWENKSRSMIRLCNDFNLIVPDEVLVYAFLKFEEKFGINYQDIITKTNYRVNTDVRILISEIIAYFNERILRDMDTNNFVKFKHETNEESNRLILEII